MNELIFYDTINLSGIIIGAYSFINIVIARWICIVGEYYVSKRLWIGFLLFGLTTIGISLFTPSLIVGSILSITGFTYLWGIHEIIEQEERVTKGWYPRNPNRK